MLKNARREDSRIRRGLAGSGYPAAEKGAPAIHPAFCGRIIVDLEVEVVRVRITLSCTECKQRNYNMTKEKKNHPERLETRKYCRFCQKHTMHKETK